MGIAKNALYRLSQCLPLLGNLSDKKILTLGVQDCHFSNETLLEFLRRHSIPHNPLSAGDVLLTTGFKHLSEQERQKSGQYVHQKTLFRTLGFSAENISALDYSTFEGAEVVHDLNNPVPAELEGKFDLILDGGTIEHVFSLKDAFSNLIRMTRSGGLIVHFSPVDFINHGFINLNAELVHDVYLANGFEEITVKYMAIPNHQRRSEQHYLEFDPHQFPFSLQPYYATFLHGVYRKLESKPFSVPQQGMYSSLWSKNEGTAKPVRGPFLRSLREWANGSLLATEILMPLMVRRRGKKVRL
jgi:hypothetical protein